MTRLLAYLTYGAATFTVTAGVTALVYVPERVAAVAWLTIGVGFAAHRFASHVIDAYAGRGWFA